MCECKLCLRTRKFEEELDKIPAELREFWLKLYDDLNHAEMDRDYYKCIVDGSWPSSEEILASYRNK